MASPPDPSQLERLASGVLQVGFDGPTIPPWLRRALDDGLGGVLLFSRNLPSRSGEDAAKHAAELVAALRADRGQVVIAIDEEGGRVTRIQARTGSSWPGNGALGVVDDPALTGAVAGEIGAWLACLGITLDYAPVVDIASGPANPVIGTRSFGHDPARVARHTAAWIKGLQDAGVAACAKHFPGHGGTSIDSHHDLPTVVADRALLDARELVPFRAAIAAGVKAIMCGHLKLPALDPHVPASMSRATLTGLLRTEMGFTGLIVTDAIEMRAVADRWPAPEIAVRALDAGADLICVGASSPDGSSVAELRAGIVDAVRDGRLAEERLFDAVTRIQTLSAWHAAAPRPTATTTAPPTGLIAARRALRTYHEGHRLTEPPVVVELRAGASSAVDHIDGSLLAHELNRLLPGTHGTVVPIEDGRVPRGALERGGGSSGETVVVIVGDSLDRAHLRILAADVVQAAPDATVVDMSGAAGPHDEPVAGVHVVTHGCSQAAAAATAQWLTRRGSERR
jgi:beta-N-acetylhexosaminidase